MRSICDRKTVLLFFCLLFFGSIGDNLYLEAARVPETKSSLKDSYKSFEETAQRYFKENKYSEYVEYLKSLNPKNTDLEPVVNYYIALSRYYQLKYLENTENWNEYFNNGNEYRNQIEASTQKAIEHTMSTDPVSIYSKLVLWRLHRDQEDNISDSALSELMKSVLEYSKTSGDAVVIKDVADQLRASGEKMKSKELYNIYVDRIVTPGASARFDTKKNAALESAAQGFYKEENLELAETMYDAYIERISQALPKEKLIPLLVNIAKQFSYKSEGVKDLLYSEKIFKKIEEIGTKSAFDEELLYWRAFNLEKTKLYDQAKDVYADMINRFPQSLHCDEANYKIAVIYTYVLHDVKSGKGYFEKLAQPIMRVLESNEGAITQKETVTAQAISSVYQLGLLNQWENDFTKAKKYYTQLIESAKGDFADKVALCKERLKEIDETKPMEYNLKTFLDISLKEENALFDGTKVDLRSLPYFLRKNENINVNASAFPGETGCMQVKLEYLWSGDLGNAQPSTGDSTFETTYSNEGVKVINLVVATSSGVLDRNIELVSVY